MPNGRPSADIEVGIPGAVLDVHRERVSVRRRRSRQGHHRSNGSAWVAASRSRRRAVRAFALSAGVLLLMAIGLYFGLSRQESSAPAEGAARTGVVGAAGLV
ncbi:MAG TPA: hypothetical protein VKZ18_13045 [Polyangia bacterium]|nr:hypothetical protein [Polyangia bacterium]